MSAIGPKRTRYLAWRVGMAAAGTFIPNPAAFCAGAQAEAEHQQAETSYHEAEHSRSLSVSRPRIRLSKAVAGRWRSHPMHASIAHLDDERCMPRLFSMDESPI
jgi:hypothetical protein